MIQSKITRTQSSVQKIFMQEMPSNNHNDHVYARVNAKHDTSQSQLLNPQLCRSLAKRLSSLCSQELK